MKEILHQFLLGIGAIILAPSGNLPPPRFTITLPPENAMQGICFDFSNVSKDLAQAIDKVQNADQMELELNLERGSA